MKLLMCVCVDSIAMFEVAQRELGRKDKSNSMFVLATVQFHMANLKYPKRNVLDKFVKPFVWMKGVNLDLQSSTERSKHSKYTSVRVHKAGRRPPSLVA